MTAKKEIETHAAKCRSARTEGRSLPVWQGGGLIGADLRCAVLIGADLSGADLSGADLIGADLSSAVLRGAYLRGAILRVTDLRDADLTGAILTGAILRGATLRGADLRGADLRGALITEGAVADHIAGLAGGYRWHALRLQDGAIVLQYGCERHPLAVWQGRGPDYGVRYGHDEDHWAGGPAIAIAAAKALITKPASIDAKESQ